MKKIGLVAAGMYVPEKKLTNADLVNMVDTTDEWIVSRTGINERRIAPDDMHASDMAARAAQDCLNQVGVSPDILIASTSTGEMRCPYQASIVANKLNLKNLAAFDLSAACSGLVYAITVAKSMLQTNEYRHALITAGEKMSMVTDYTDRASCILFGDGASSVFISSEIVEHEILTTELGLDATGSDLVVMGGPGSDFYFRQDGKNVYKFAVNIINDLIKLLKERTGLGPNDHFYVIPHQANSRMLESVAKSMNIPWEQFIVNIDKYGNTSSASIGLALKEAWDSGRFKKDDIIFLIGFGGGLSWAAAAIRW